MELLGLVLKALFASLVLSAGIFAALIMKAWLKQPKRRVKLGFMGFSVELGEDNS